MKVALQILAVCGLLLLLGIDTTSGLVLSKDIDSSVPSELKVLYEAIFNSSALVQTLNEVSNSEDDPAEICSEAYNQQNGKILAPAGEKLRQCMLVSQNDIDAYFTEKNSKHFERKFTRRIERCSYKRTSSKTMDCYVDTIALSLREVKPNASGYTWRQKRCIYFQMTSIARKSSVAISKLRNCIRQAQFDSTTSRPTTERPLFPPMNSTEKPLFPPMNTTEWPQWNSTLFPPMNTTEWPQWNSTLFPPMNTTEWPQWNTTVSQPMNTTEHWNTSVSPSEPIANSTALPLENTTVADNNSDDGNSSWLGKIWQKLKNLF